MSRVRVDARNFIDLQARRGMSNFDLICEAGVSGSTLNRALKGGAVDVRTLGRFARALKCEPGQLLKVTMEPRRTLEYVQEIL
jgi:DNA-binding Xre family transcriptional regulator